MNTFGIQRAPWLRRLGWKLLPPTRLNHDAPWPSDCGDVIRVTTEVHLGLKDRLRVFIQGRLLVESITFTEHKAGRCESSSGISTA